ncbi:MAG: PAS domain-containing protein, partial [Psychrosphaera sp.]|nr:PAS domain-containing protein [Psychrosphaera sp.]
KTADTRIYDIQEVTPGHFWLASHQQGILNFDAGTGHVIHYSFDPKNQATLSRNQTTSLVLQQQYLWVATLNGLNRLNVVTGQNKRFYLSDGLPSNVVYRILPDDQGNIWGSTSKGLFRLNLKSGQIVPYGLKYGLQGSDFTTFGAYRSPDGELFFGGAGGFNSFYPDTITPTKAPTAALLSELRVLNKPVQPGLGKVLNKVLHQSQKLTLPHYQNLFSMAFSSLEYTDPQDLQYSYKLEGFHDNWLAALPGKPQATFTNLDAGTYRFVTRTRRGNGPWSESGKGLEIEILPPTWATWWAYGAYLVFTALILFAFYRQGWHKRLQHKTYLRNLEQRKKQLDLALWGSGDELWEWDIKQQKMTRFNCLENGGERYFPGEFSPEFLSQFIHQDDIEQVMAALNAHLRGESDIYEQSYRMRARDKSWIWVLDRGQIVEKDLQGNPLRFSGTIKNISTLKRTEDQLRLLTQELELRVTKRTIDLENRTEDLQKTNTHLQETLRALKLTQRQLDEIQRMAALGNLVMGVSHEINTPLGISVTALSTLAEESNKLFEQKNQGKLTSGSFDQFESQAKECIQLLSNNLTRTTHVVEKFKQVAVNQSDELLHDFNLACLLRDSLITATARYSNLTFELDVDCEYDIYMCSYPQSLTRVFIQLVENTFEHRPDK